MECSMDGLVFGLNACLILFLLWKEYKSHAIRSDLKEKDLERLQGILEDEISRILFDISEWKRLKDSGDHPPYLIDIASRESALRVAEYELAIVKTALLIR